jgi:DNA-binding XRE family transcriptional regulator
MAAKKTPAKKAKPRPVGRPTRYTPELGKKVLDAMSIGFSVTAAAGIIDVTRQTLYVWEETIPDFFDTLKLARAKRVAFLENKLITAEVGPAVTASIFALKNACPEEWREKIEHSGPDGGPIKVVIGGNA